MQTIGYEFVIPDNLDERRVRSWVARGLDRCVQFSLNQIMAPTDLDSIAVLEGLVDKAAKAVVEEAKQASFYADLPDHKVEFIVDRLHFPHGRREYRIRIAFRPLLRMLNPFPPAHVMTLAEWAEAVAAIDRIRKEMLRRRRFRPHRRRPYPRNLATREPMEDECGWCNRKSRRFRAKARPLLAF